MPQGYQNSMLLTKRPCVVIPCMDYTRENRRLQSILDQIRKDQRNLYEFANGLRETNPEQNEIRVKENLKFLFQREINEEIASRFIKKKMNKVLGYSDSSRLNEPSDEESFLEEVELSKKTLLTEVKIESSLPLIVKEFNEYLEARKKEVTRRLAAQVGLFQAAQKTSKKSLEFLEWLFDPKQTASEKTECFSRRKSVSDSFVNFLQETSGESRRDSNINLAEKRLILQRYGFSLKHK